MDVDQEPQPRVEKLTRRQQAFVEQYVIDLNATQAAIRAGYASNSAGPQAYDLLQLPHIKNAVDRALSQRSSRVNMQADQVLHEMSLLSHARIDHYVVSDEGQVELAEGAPDGAMAAIQSIKRKTHVKYDNETGVEIGRTYDVEIKLWDKPTPLKLMGRHVGLFADRVEHTGKDGGPIETVTKVERVIIDAPKDDEA